MTATAAATRTTTHYGEAPHVVGTADFSESWREFMHYQYLPVILPATETGGARPGARLPANLEFLRTTVFRCAQDYFTHMADVTEEIYVYVTARRGFAMPGAPLNREGWHTDDFGGHDINYVWCDRFPTRFLVSEADLGPEIPDDHLTSVDAFDRIAADQHLYGAEVFTYPENTLLRLTPHVIHATPDVPGPGAMRSFVKISISPHRYDLDGNSHNFDLDYEWDLTARKFARNDPSTARLELVDA